MSTSTLPAGAPVIHWTVSHGLSGYLPMTDDTTAWLSWSDAREALLADMRDYADTDDDAAWDALQDDIRTYPLDADGNPELGDDAPSMLATVQSMIADGDVAPTHGAEWTGHVVDSDGRTIYFSLSRHTAGECEDSCDVIDADRQSYVVTFAAGPVLYAGNLAGLQRMTLEQARALVAEASRIPKRGRIIDVNTLAVVD